jgi:hypothetical protein
MGFHHEADQFGDPENPRKKRGKAKQKATKNVKLKINYFYEQIPNLPISSTIHCHPDGL